MGGSSVNLLQRVEFFEGKNRLCFGTIEVVDMQVADMLLLSL